MIDALKTFKLYKLFFMSMFSVVWGFLIANNYKNYGLLFIDNDSFMTQVGSIGALGNGLSRLFWGFILDYVSFKKLYFWILFI